MVSNKKTARLAGLLYLVVVITGVFGLLYVPSKLIVWDNAATTFTNIAGSETLFRLGILSNLTCYTFFVFLPLVLYKLLKQVNENHAKLMVILAIISIPISFILVLNKFAVLSLVSGENYLKVFSNEQLQAQVLFYLKQYENGIQVVSIFWGLWLFPFGYLVFKSGFLPKIPGILLMVGSICYLINFLGGFLIPGYHKTVISTLISLPESLSEIGICLWLLIMGAKDKPLPGDTLQEQ
jgi:Domain of unknown function (DUF4386)